MNVDAALALLNPGKKIADEQKSWEQFEGAALDEHRLSDRKLFQ